jgi:UDP-N-acetylglucosamine 1-carboxyvinyltransferase
VDKFYIQGPCRLEGRVAASGAKNAALPALAATLLTDEPVTLKRMPEVQDIRTMCKLLEHLSKGCKQCDGMTTIAKVGPERPVEDAPYDLVKTMRASVLVLGPLVARRGRARVSLPGGCSIGVRPIDQHLSGLEALGADVTLERGYVTAEADHLKGTRFRFSVPTVTGTENVLMAATLARGTTVLENCAQEPEIGDLARLLVEMGAKIEGIGTDTLTIHGVDELGGAEHSVIADRIEGGTYLLGALMTGGDVTLMDSEPADLAPLLTKLAEAGAEVTPGARDIRVRANGVLKPVEVETHPHPGFPTDLQAQLMAALTRAEGVSRIRETVFENRYQHVPELARMGADIMVEGNEAKIRGVSRLTGANVMATDLRASASLVLAGLAAEGETVVDRIYHLDRGYEDMESKLQKLGARVERKNPGPHM